MHIKDWAERTPDTPALIMAGSGETVTYAELEAASNRGAHLLRSLGLKRGDAFALWSTNNARFSEISWAMQRSGLYMTPIASKLKAAEAAYIVNDCQARVLIVDASIGPAAAELARDIAKLCPAVEKLYAIREPLDGVERWEEATAAMPATPIPDQSQGRPMVYSSGTTGRPKGVRIPLSDIAFDETPPALFNNPVASEPGTVFIITAPLYHVGTFSMLMHEQRAGVTVVLMEKFDPEKLLAAIQKYRARHVQCVPTMFVRLLKLPEEVRASYDVSSLKLAVHSAAPCPVDVKKAMIDWWGPILFEIYGGTEAAGLAVIDSHEWLRKPGSVGRVVLGIPHICDEAGDELPQGETGILYFESNQSYSYFNDPEKTKEVQNPKHPSWRTYGDIGRIDEDGYLFLSDRRSFMIISGGVNIYPQEAENVLSLHPDVQDVAVFGVPDPDMGEQVKAVVQPVDWAKAGPALEAELIAYCKSKLASLKCPKSIDFEPTLPRDITGKMMKRELRARYWDEAQPAAAVAGS